MAQLPPKFFVTCLSERNMFSGLLGHAVNLVGEALPLEILEGQQLSGTDYDKWGCQPPSEVEYWGVYDCLGIKLHSPVSA